MKHYLCRVKITFLVLIITFFNCAFVSPNTNNTYKNSNSFYNTIIPARSGLRVEKGSFIEQIMNKMGQKKKQQNKGLIALVVFLAILLTLLLAFGIFIFAWGGASGMLLAVVGIAGLVLIIVGASRIIRAIKRKSSTAFLKFKKINKSNLYKNILPNIKTAQDKATAI